MRRRGWGAALLAVLALALPASAQEAASGTPLRERLGLSGSARLGYWTSDRRLTDRQGFTPASLWLKATPDFGNGFSGRFEGWLYDERPLAGAHPRAELREAFVSWRGDALGFGAGRRIVAWGRADRVNPTDVIGSRDYTLLTPDDGDQRRGSLMTTGSYAFGDFTATAYWLPEFRPNVFPLEPTPGVAFVRQDGRFDPAQGALRLDHSGGDVDWALSYFDGIDRDPTLRIAAAGPAGLTVATAHERRRTIGADFATNIGDYGLRGEIAYSRFAAGGAALAFDKRPFVAAVIGADRNVTEHLNLNVQYVLDYVTDYADPRAIADPATRAVAVRAALLDNQLERVQHGMTFRAAYTMLDDTLTLELAAAAFFTDGSAVVRPKLRYQVSDAVTAIAGLDLFFGPDLSYFGQLRRNRTAYVELRYGF